MGAMNPKDQKKKKKTYYGEAFGNSLGLPHIYITPAVVM